MKCLSEFFSCTISIVKKKTGTKNKFFFYYKWSLACDITQLLTIKWKILFPRRKKKTTSGMFMYWVHLPSAIFFMHSVWREKLRISAAFNIKNSASER